MRRIFELKSLYRLRRRRTMARFPAEPPKQRTGRTIWSIKAGASAQSQSQTPAFTPMARTPTPTRSSVHHHVRLRPSPRRSTGRHRRERPASRLIGVNSSAIIPRGEEEPDFARHFGIRVADALPASQQDHPLVAVPRLAAAGAAIAPAAASMIFRAGKAEGDSGEAHHLGAGNSPPARPARASLRRRYVFFAPAWRRLEQS